jgi:hypothetical protein
VHLSLQSRFVGALVRATDTATAHSAQTSTSARVRRDRKPVEV